MIIPENDETEVLVSKNDTYPENKLENDTINPAFCNNLDLSVNETSLYHCWDYSR